MIIGEHALIRTFKNHITKAICCSWRGQDIINAILESHVSIVEPKSHNLEFQALFVILLLFLMPFVSSVVILNKSIAQRICLPEKWFSVEDFRFLY